jgi:uncharacterized repeat protein (TIGR03806 family)
VPPAPQSVRPLPERLSQTGIFSSLSTLSPAPGVVPYDVNVPYWTDGALTRRWIILPGDGSSSDPLADRVIVKPNLPWSFPTGTVLVQHFDWADDESRPDLHRRLETRVLVRDKDGAVYGLTYRWLRDGSDATLLRSAADETLTTKRADGSTSQVAWSYPSPDQCVLCHNPAAAGGVLGVNYRQLNRTVRYPDRSRAINQVVAWNSAQMLSKSLDEPSAFDIWNLIDMPGTFRVPFWSLPRLGRLDPPGDETAPIEDRARAYLDANCSYCHAPGIVNADFDARSTTPFAEQRFVGVKARIPRLGAETLIEPGAPERSLLYLRLLTTDPTVRMPPLGRDTVDAQGARLIESWIRGMPAGSQPAPGEKR